MYIHFEVVKSSNLNKKRKKSGKKKTYSNTWTLKKYVSKIAKFVIEYIRMFQHFAKPSELKFWIKVLKFYSKFKSKFIILIEIFK